MTIGMGTGPSQAGRRQDLNAEDQFGRVWSLTIEKATGDPTGQITQAGWEDPLNTPQQYLRVPRNRFGQPAHGKIEVSFVRWMQDIRADLTGWMGRVYACAQKFYPSGFDPKTIHEDPLVAQAAGPQPWPPVPVLEAASRGHRGYLGLEPLTAGDRALLGRFTVEDLVRHVAEAAGGITPEAPAESTAPAPVNPTETWPQFLARRRKAGLTMQEAAAEWRGRHAVAA